MDPESTTSAPIRIRHAVETGGAANRAPGLAPGLVAAGAYLACSLALFHGVLGGLSSRGAYGASGDNATMAWFLGWTPHALLHGQDPFLTYAINAPTGVSALWNSSMPLAGVVMAPVTLTLGPLASLNVLFILGPTLTAVTGRWWLSRHTSSEAGRFVGGLVAGFGFFVTAHLGGHLNFVVLPLIPVMLRLAEDVLWRAGDHRLRSGVWLGVATAAQAMVSEEMVAIVVTGAVVAGVLAAINAPRTVLPELRRAVPGTVVAAVTAAVLLAVPLSVQLFGPNSLGGIDGAARYFAAKRDFLVPSSRFLIAPVTQDANLVGRGSNGAEDAVYLGLPLFVLLGATAVCWWRRWPVRVALLTVAAAGVLTLGPGLRPDGTAGWSRPGAPLFHLPAFVNVLPVRFGLVMQLACAWVLAMVVGSAVREIRQRRQALAGWAAVAGSILVLVSLIPAPPPDQVSAGVPSYFTSDEVRAIPQDSLVALVPSPWFQGIGLKAMLYEAETGQRFRMLGGYAWLRTRAGNRSSFALPDPVMALGNLASTRPGGLDSITRAEVADTRQQMADLGVQAVIVVMPEDPGGWYSGAARAVYGRPSQDVGGVEVWRTDTNSRRTAP